MTRWVGRRASGDRASWVAAAVALLAAGACTGAEHTVFSAIPPPPAVTPPPDRMQDAAPAPQPDGGAPEPPDAGDEDAGVLADPELDPNVTFTWTETLPGQGTCKAGAYAGSFTCAAAQTDPSELAPLPVSGQVVFTLGDLSEEQELSVTEGAIKDVITLGFVFNSTLRGSLACRDDHFTAEAVDGMIGFGTFEAALDGVFDAQALEIDGAIVIVDGAGQRCEGDFHVSASP